MKPPNHGKRVLLTCTDEGDDLEFTGYLALDPRPARRPDIPEIGLVLVMDDLSIMPIYASDRIELGERCRP